MCQYIKDDGEQCGMDQEPFCRHHDDTKQAELHNIGQEMFEGGDMPTGGQFAQLISQAVDIHQEDESGSSRASSGIQMETHCEECGAALRRCERLAEHPQFGERLVFEAYVECECSEHVLGAQSVGKRRLPDGWSG